MGTLGLHMLKIIFFLKSFFIIIIFLIQFVKKNNFSNLSIQNKVVCVLLKELNVNSIFLCYVTLQ